eukprot:m.144349 g.144349  ORF g.144349 m.144349 type:complete len:83 (+) comp24247_c0_seq4:92-340(+)
MFPTFLSGADEAYVTYSSSSDARHAVHEMRGKRFFGHTVLVKLASPRNTDRGGRPQDDRAPPSPTGDDDDFDSLLRAAISSR